MSVWQNLLTHLLIKIKSLAEILALGANCARRWDWDDAPLSQPSVFLFVCSDTWRCDRLTKMVQRASALALLELPVDEVLHLAVLVLVEGLAPIDDAHPRDVQEPAVLRVGNLTSTARHAARAE